MTQSLQILILAAGYGNRMYSQLPKVLHKIAGVPMLERIIQTALALQPASITIVYRNDVAGQLIRTALQHYTVNWVSQTIPLGTGHAVLMALPLLQPQAKLLILYGDLPLIEATTLKDFIAQLHQAELAILSTTLANPTGFGRIIRQADSRVVAIIEERDATTEQLAITEVNSGIMLVTVSLLQHYLPQLTNHNTQQEYYLTDLVNIAVQQQIVVAVYHLTEAWQVMGVNNQLQRALVERQQQKLQVEQLMLAGLTVMDPARFDLRGCLSVGQDVVCDINVILEGQIVIGNNCLIGPNSYLKNVIIGNNVTIKANCVLEDVVLANGCIIGPFANLRPGTVLAEHVQIGNFVEVKNSKIGAASKANHLSYLGDAQIGSKVNIGAGAITCNYDGQHKHCTTIEDGAFIGVNTALRAPVTIGKNATIGAGSVITKHAPADKLTLARATQVTVENWQRKG